MEILTTYYPSIFTTRYTYTIKDQFSLDFYRKIMSFFWVQLTTFVIALNGYFWLTFVFCFWFIYFVDSIKRKRNIYKTTLRCIQGEYDYHQHMLAYNAKTDLVKFAMLFCLNLVEWVGCTFVILSFCGDFVQTYRQEFPTNHSLYIPSRRNSTLHKPFFDNVCVVTAMAIIGSLCMYLSARYAQKSWIKSNRIPYWICFFLLSSVVVQILVIFCDTYIIGMWYDKILVISSVIFAWKQYRKLNMVLQWFIVDLRVSGEIQLLERHVRMKRRFNRIFTTIWIGVSCGVVANLLCVISHTTQIIFNIYHHSFTDGFLCDTSVHSHLVSYITAVLYVFETLIGLTGVLIFFIPYIGYGLCTMSVLLWRLFRGETGYRTHFPVQLTTPLV